MLRLENVWARTILAVIAAAIFGYTLASIRLSTGVASTVSYERSNATLYTLCREDDLDSLVATLFAYEDRFNHRYHYDWIFLNDVEFSDEFKRVVSGLVSGEAKFGVLPSEMWDRPTWIDEDKMHDSFRALAEKGVAYAENESYRKMCRFNSGLFYEHPLMKEYRYYWRVDGDTKVFCDLDVDPFKYMEENNIKYGFTLSMYENMATIPSLWESTLKFFSAYPGYLAKDNLAGFLTDDGGYTYNGCHFWTNFEIADADFWRSEAFTTYFNFLDRLGGFYYERWGDAPVHSIAASLLLPKDQIAHFDFIGYSHPPVAQVPSDFLDRPRQKCGVNPIRNFDWNDQYNCIEHFYHAQLPEVHDLSTIFGLM